MRTREKFSQPIKTANSNSAFYKLFEFFCFSKKVRESIETLLFFILLKISLRMYSIHKKSFLSETDCSEDFRFRLGFLKTNRVYSFKKKKNKFDFFVFSCYVICQAQIFLFEKKQIMSELLKKQHNVSFFRENFWV